LRQLQRYPLSNRASRWSYDINRHVLSGDIWRLILRTTHVLVYLIHPITFGNGKSKSDGSGNSVGQQTPVTQQQPQPQQPSDQRTNCGCIQWFACRWCCKIESLALPPLADHPSSIAIRELLHLTGTSTGSNKATGSSSTNGNGNGNSVIPSSLLPWLNIIRSLPPILDDMEQLPIDYQFPAHIMALINNHNSMVEMDELVDYITTHVSALAHIRPLSVIISEYIGTPPMYALPYVIHRIWSYDIIQQLYYQRCVLPPQLWCNAPYWFDRLPIIGRRITSMSSSSSSSSSSLTSTPTASTTSSTKVIVPLSSVNPTCRSLLSSLSPEAVNQANHDFILTSSTVDDRYDDRRGRQRRWQVREAAFKSTQAPHVIDYHLALTYRHHLTWPLLSYGYSYDITAVTPTYSLPSAGSLFPSYVPTEAEVMSIGKMRGRTGLWDSFVLPPLPAVSSSSSEYALRVTHWGKRVLSHPYHHTFSQMHIIVVDTAYGHTRLHMCCTIAGGRSNRHQMRKWLHCFSRCHCFIITISVGFCSSLVTPITASFTGA
jgi:hypothetical protein